MSLALYRSKEPLPSHVSLPCDTRNSSRLDLGRDTSGSLIVVYGHLERLQGIRRDAGHAWSWKGSPDDAVCRRNAARLLLAAEGIRLPVDHDTVTTIMSSLCRAAADSGTYLACIMAYLASQATNCPRHLAQC